MKKLTAFIACCLITGTTLSAETVRVGAYENPPKVFTTQSGQTAGFFPAILQAVAEEQGWDIVYVHGAWEECLERLESGEIDLMCDVAVSKDRKNRFSFSKEPVLTNWGAVYVRKGMPIRSVLDLDGKAVAVMAGSIHTDGIRGIKALLENFNVSCRFVEVSSYREVLMLLDSGQADAGVVNRLFGMLHADNHEASATPIVFNPCDLQFAVKKGVEKGLRLIEQIDSSLRRLKQNPDSAYHQALTVYLAGSNQEWASYEEGGLQQLELSAAEARWAKDHPRIRIGIDPGFAPFEFLSRDGEYTGMAADYLDLLSTKTGLEFERAEYDSWSETVQAIKQKEIDLLPCVGISEERKGFIDYTAPYLNFSRVIITRIDSDIKKMSDLSGRRVGIQENSSHSEFLKETTMIKPRLYESFQDAMLAVSRGEVDATVGNLAVTTHVMRDLALTNIKLAAYAAPESQALCIGVRKDWPELRSILDRALQSITLKQRSAILGKWLPLPRASRSDLEFSQEEREWLLMHPCIRVAWDRNWAPIEFADSDGVMQGVSSEYLKSLQRILGVYFDVEQAGNWQEAYTMLKNRDLDMSSCLAITPQRMEHLDFTDTYLSTPVVLFGNGSTPYIRNMSELEYLRVAVVKDYATDHWITRDVPELSVTRTATLADGFELLRRGKVDVFIANVVTGNYYLSHLRHHNIKIVGETPYAYKLRMAVRNDWPLFAGILTKALNSLPEGEKNAMYRDWVWVKYEHGFDYSLFGKIVMGALAVILMFVYWNRRLTAEVRQRKQAEAALCEREKELRESNEHLRQTEKQKEDLTHMIVHDMRSPLTTISASVEMMQMEQPAFGDSCRNHLNMLQAGVSMLTRMIQGLLDVSRLETHKMPISHQEADLRKVAENAVQMMQPRAKMANVSLEFSGTSSVFQMDTDLIARIITNLIENAIRASSEGSKVGICVGDKAVEIRDFGKGIPPEDMGRIFEKFGRAETNGKPHRRSVGLGLTFCKLAAEAHGGRIRVTSEEGKGSTFRLEL